MTMALLEGHSLTEAADSCGVTYNTAAKAVARFRMPSSRQLR